MVDHVESLAKTVRADWPDTHCFRCLALDLAVSEKAVRDAGQLLLFRDAIMVQYRVSASCHRVEDGPVAKQLSQMSDRP